MYVYVRENEIKKTAFAINHYAAFSSFTDCCLMAHSKAIMQVVCSFACVEKKYFEKLYSLQVHILSRLSLTQLHWTFYNLHMYVSVVISVFLFALFSATGYIVENSLFSVLYCIFGKFLILFNSCSFISVHFLLHLLTDIPFSFFHCCAFQNITTCLLCSLSMKKISLARTRYILFDSNC